MARKKSEFGPNLGNILQGAPAALVGQFLASFKRPDDTLLAPPEITVGTTDDQGKAALSAYRCFYVKNNHGSLTLQTATVWVQTSTPSPDTSAEIGLGASAINGVEPAAANESAAPGGVTFSTANGEANALSIGGIPAGQHKAIWLKRIVNAGAAAYNADSVVVKVQGDTAA